MLRLVVGAGQGREGSLPPAGQGHQQPVIDSGPSLDPWRGSGWAALPGGGPPTPLARRGAALQARHARLSQRGPPTPHTARSANTTSPGCAPTWRCGAAASGACPASASASARAAPSVPAGRPLGGTPPPSAAQPPAPHAAPAAPPPASGRTPSRPAWLP